MHLPLHFCQNQCKLLSGHTSRALLLIEPCCFVIIQCLVADCEHGGHPSKAAIVHTAHNPSFRTSASCCPYSLTVIKPCCFVTTQCLVADCAHGGHPGKAAIVCTAHNPSLRTCASRHQSTQHHPDVHPPSQSHRHSLGWQECRGVHLHSQRQVTVLQHSHLGGAGAGQKGMCSLYVPDQGKGSD